MGTGQADMGNQQGNRQGDKGTNRATWEVWQSGKGGSRVRTEGLRQRQGETGKDPTKLGMLRNDAQTQKNTLLLDSEKIIIGSLQSEKIGSLKIHIGYLTFSFKKTGFRAGLTE